MPQPNERRDAVGLTPNGTPEPLYKQTNKQFFSMPFRKHPFMTFDDLLTYIYHPRQPLILRLFLTYLPALKSDIMYECSLGVNLLSKNRETSLVKGLFS